MLDVADEAVIVEDIEQSLLKRVWLFNHQEENFEVVKRNFLNPKQSSLVLPVYHPHGLYMYYTELTSDLLLVLQKRIYPSRLGSKSPDYVRDFANRKGK